MLNELVNHQAVSISNEFEVRLLEHSDIPEIISMLAEPKVTEFLFFAPSPNEVYEGYFKPIAETIAKARADNQQPECVVLTAREKTTGEFAGDIGLMPTMFCSGNFEIGFQVPLQFWGQGIATAGARLLTKIAFEELGAHKVNADLYGGNEASEHVLGKLGYVKEGQLKDYYKTDSGIDDKVFFGMTARQYEQLPK